LFFGEEILNFLLNHIRRLGTGYGVVHNEYVRHNKNDPFYNRISIIVCISPVTPRNMKICLRMYLFFMPRYMEFPRPLSYNKIEIKIKLLQLGSFSG